MIPSLKDVKLTKTSSKSMGEKLVKYEKRLQNYQYKFGVLYVKENQTKEDEMFSNSNSFPWFDTMHGLNFVFFIAKASPLFDEFLDLLGSKIKLLGWSGYTGGLDVKSKQTNSFNTS